MAASMLHAWLRTVRADPCAPALIDVAKQKIWTRRELDELGADWLSLARQPLAGRIVLFAEANGTAWLRIFLGLLRAGAVAAPLDPGEPTAWRLAAAKRIGASYLWSSGQLIGIEGGSRSHKDGRRLLKLTSGSSGEPRAFPFTDAQMLADGRHICTTMEIRPDDVNLGLIPFGHSYGLGNLVIPLLVQGNAIVCPASPLPHALGNAVERWRTTVFPGVPAVLRALVESGVEPSKVGSLRTVISAGAPLTADLAQSFRTRFGRVIHNFYGSSETGGIAYDRTGEAGLNDLGVGTRLHGVRLAFGRGRRFTVTSPAVFTLGNRRMRGAQGTHSPADLAEIGSDGIVRLLGRAGRWLKVGSRRLSPAEVERAIKGLTGVRDAIVTQHPARPNVLAAAISGQTSAGAVREALAARLASWKIPKKILVVPEFPLTPRGKPDVRQLRALLGA